VLILGLNVDALLTDGGLQQQGLGGLPDQPSLLQIHAVEAHGEDNAADETPESYENPNPFVIVTAFRGRYVYLVRFTVINVDAIASRFTGEVVFRQACDAEKLPFHIANLLVALQTLDTISRSISTRVDLHRVSPVEDSARQGILRRGASRRSN